ncbi:PstS family phosphate ABC transporter substrate-binding protein [Amycolatopsis jiangsuensis]|uniref:ABC-type phosphate transport system substrate-binding protein n=1 Tax=Amycolatopsis jiangsuensis TaxID=1181879 RepID=A0A840J4X2_9PSEU|nr:substrate-binding domain-containing protein [Amycolatopsis jiangsuensis]MBB4688482.1 ABC-type phosphate transport system substrate-binding protein [Amycolatopsis jiangsuensis]
MGFGEIVRSLAEVLTSGRGIVPIAVVAGATIAAPLIDRYVIRRRRLLFRVLYNSKIGLSPVILGDGHDGAAQQDPELARTVRLLEPLSVVVIRIRNTGSFDIRPEDFEHPLQFTFGDRVVWDARVSEARDGLRDVVRNGLEFFTDHEPDPEPVPESARLSGLRALLPQRLTDFLRQPDPSAVRTRAPQWHGVQLGQLSLKRREKFKLVVVLREPDSWPGGTLSKEWAWTGRLGGGRIKDERKQRWLSWPVITVAIGVLLTGALISTLIVAASQSAEPGCGTGSLSVHGSSAFAPIIDNVAHEYHRQCPGAGITTRATGSVSAVRELGPLPPEGKDSLAVLSDGKATGPDLVAQPVAVLMYSMVVNSAAGVDRLTTDQVRGIFGGRYRDWAQLRPGPSLPIRIVGRGQESGTRITFEHKVLSAAEPALSSDDCRTAGRAPDATVVRCERGTTAELLHAVGETPGAVGYADAPAAKVESVRGGKVTVAQLDGRYPDATSIDAGYRFWTVEYLYTKGVPENDSLLKLFLDYLRSSTARAELQDAGYTPCVTKQGLPEPHCTRPDA